MDTILEEYIRKHPSSASLYEEAMGHFPGGVTHDTRYLLPFPLYVTRASGPLKWDVDGNEYVDYVSGHGALILGHSHPAITSAVAEQLPKGSHMGASTQEEMRWARAIKALMPSVEKIRFQSSGTEATLMALRMARAYTGKRNIIKFQDHFHGWHDYVVTRGDMPTPGVPETTTKSMIVIPAGDIANVERAIVQDGDVAGVILEPTGAHMGQLPLAPLFLERLREVTRSHGVLLIMDEVVTGFRVSQGGAQGRFGIDPDLTTMAKIVAGGLPGGAVGGKAEIVDMLAFRGDPEWDGTSRIAHQGTFNANPLSAVAGATCLEMIANQAINDRADAMALRLKNGLNDAFARMAVAGHAHGTSSLVHLTMRDCDCDREVCSMSHRKLKESAVPTRSGPLKRALINAGVDVMGGGTLIVSAAHREVDVDRSVAAFEEALAAMSRDGIA